MMAIVYLIRKGAWRGAPRVRAIDAVGLQLVGNTLWRLGAGVRLEPQMAEMAAAMMIAGFVTWDDMAQFVWPDPEDQPDGWLEVLRRRAFALRRRLDPIGVEVLSRRGRGWEMEVRS